MCVSIYTNKCNMQHLNNGFNRFKVDVYMLIIQDMWKKSLNYLSIIRKNQVVCVSMYYNKCKMKLVSNNFNILNVNGSIHVQMLIVEMIWKNHQLILV